MHFMISHIRPEMARLPSLALRFGEKYQQKSLLTYHPYSKVVSTPTSPCISCRDYHVIKPSTFATRDILRRYDFDTEMHLLSKKNVSQFSRSSFPSSARNGDHLDHDRSGLELNRPIQKRHYSSPRDTIATAVNLDRVATESGMTDGIRAKQQSHYEAMNQLLTQKSGLFDDHRQSYGTNSTSAILRALMFFFFCKFNALTNNAEKITNLTRCIMGRRLSDVIIRAVMFDQFVVDPTPEAILKAARDLGDKDIGILLAVPIEDDAKSDGVQEATFDNNLDLILDSVSMASQIDVVDPLAQCRVTALMSGSLAKLVSEMCSRSVAPETNIKGNPDLPISVETINAMVKAMRGEGLDFAQIPGWEDFPSDRLDELERALTRFGALAKSLKERNVTAMLDAEKTYLNPALRHLVFSLMEICNKDKPLVFYTYQAYLKSTYGMLSKDLALAQSRGTCFGVKLVRGAYMVTERQMASEEGYEDPVNETFDLTSESYHRCLDLLLEKAKENEKSIRFIIASHNEDTLYRGFEKMNQLGVSPHSPCVMFGQLYGMADHISCVLGASGCRVVKSVPYGTMDATIPYLARRAQENKSVLENARKERMMLRRSLADKLIGVFR